ncbi:MAG: hypothetical protein HY747_05870 [Elusimicrobia bacterium]|nr:hypothetical protein [Elusimicrobiota bacterium]
MSFLSACLAPFAFKETPQKSLSALEARPSLKPDQAMRCYQNLAPSLRKLFNYFLRRPLGVSWQEAGQRAEPHVLFRLADLGLLVLLPDRQAPCLVAAPVEYCFLITRLDRDLGTLVSALTHYKEETLSAMAKRRGLELPGHRAWLAAALYRAIVQGLGREAGQLDDEEAEILEDTLDEDGEAGLKDLEDEFLNSRIARRRSAGPEDLILGLEHGNGDPIAALLDKGFLAADSGPINYSWQPDYDLFVPSEIKTPLKQALKIRERSQSSLTLASLGTEPAPQKTSAYAETLWFNLRRIIVTSYSRSLKMTKGGSLGLQPLRKMAALLNIEVEALNFYALFLLHAQALTMNKDEAVPNPGFLKSPQDAWKEARKRWPGWVMKVYLLQESNSARRRFASQPMVLRRALLDALMAKNGQWVSTKKLTDCILNDKKLAQKIQNQISYQWYMEPRQIRQWLKPIVEANLDFLGFFGALERDSAKLVARAGPFARNLLENSTPQEALALLSEAPSLRLILQPNLEVIAPLEMGPKEHKILNDFGRIVSLERVVVYSFSAESLYKGIAFFGSAEPLEALLAGSGPLPHAFSALLEEVKSRAGEIRIVPCFYVAQMRQAHLGKALQAIAPQAKPLEGAANVYVLETPPIEMHSVIERLKKKGYFPLVQSPKAGWDSHQSSRYPQAPHPIFANQGRIF